MKTYKLKISFIIFFSILFFYSSDAQNFGLNVKDNQLFYTPDSKGNRILDFSTCGYRNSDVDIPNLQNVIFVPSHDGDASDAIQQAIDYVSSLKPDIKGFRGAVLLGEGVFHLNKSLWIRTSGVVLRGIDKKKSILLKHGVDRGALLYIEGIDNLTESITYPIVSSYLPVNQKEIELASVANLKVGDRLIITRPSTKDWIASVGCNEFGGGISALGWKPGDIDVNWDRTVTEIKGNKITINVPLTAAIDSVFGGASVKSYRWNGRISDVGVENLTLLSDYDKNYPKDEDHCWTGISIENAENCWVRQVSFRHFAGNAVILHRTSSAITVEDCISREPISEIGGFRRITFYTLGQNNLFQRCYSEDGINDFAAGYCAPGPNAFVQCEAKRALGFSGAIDAWACGLLFDIVNVDGHNLTFKMLGQDKNGAGWGTSNSMFWQCSASEIECYSPANDAKNRAYGCWAQFSGNGEWGESNNHVHPRSLFYGQLESRLKKDVVARGRILPINTDATSSPSIEEALRMASEAYIPMKTLENWIENSLLAISVNPLGLKTPANLKAKPVRIKANRPVIELTNGMLVNNGAIITGKKIEVQWWNGKLKPKYLLSSMTKPHITRFVPGREGLGLTDRIDSVITYMKEKNSTVLDHNYGLWYDRRRDDHERIRRRDGDVWGPFYEQPFARSGQGVAWDGLSKYDLNRPNAWYWNRLKQFADKAEGNGILLFHENFFQHNIIEAGAHYVDSPWRTANNINDMGFPEPVNFAGDKRIFYANMFYDVTNANRRDAYRNYIRQGLNTFANNQNVVQLISAEYSGPLSFVQFWLDVISEWQTQTGRNALVALSTTKDVQDSILNDPKRAAVVDIIDIRYWHYKNDGTEYAPLGGQSMAPRQQARKLKKGKVTFDEAYKAVSEYKSKFPEKAVTYYGENYDQVAWAVFMAGGSCPVIPVKDIDFLQAASKMTAKSIESGKFKVLVNFGTGIIVYSQSEANIPITLESGVYVLKCYDSVTGIVTILNKSLKSEGEYLLKAKKAIYWFQRK